MSPDSVRFGPLRSSLRVLAVDDEAPSLADLVYELRTFPEIDEVVEADSAENALRALRSSTFDAVFLDVRMPGLDGLELGRILNQFKTPPPIIYVTAFDSHAVDAFDVDAVDYVLKPVRRERLAIALLKADQRRSVDTQPVAGSSVDATVKPPASAPSPASTISPPDVSKHLTEDRNPFDAEMISLEVGGRVRLIHRSDVAFVAASGDYVRLHIGASSVLLRAAMATLEEHWGPAGFVRIHRSYLVSLAHISEVRVERGRGYVVAIGDRLLPVSRRLGPQLKARLLEDAARRGRR
jgi:two-component system, LytTR family, response regulator LytT